MFVEVVWVVGMFVMEVMWARFIFYMVWVCEVVESGVFGEIMIVMVDYG